VATETKSRGAEQLLYSPEEVAQALGVGPTFARGLIREGELRGVRIGRLLKVPVTEVEAYIARRVQEADERAGGNGPHA
jgi:excisionase family DNA binding protein